MRIQLLLGVIEQNFKGKTQVKLQYNINEQKTFKITHTVKDIEFFVAHLRMQIYLSVASQSIYHVTEDGRQWN